MCLTKYHVMKTHEDVEVQHHTFLTSALGGDEWSVSHLGRFISREKYGTHYTGR